MLVKFSLMTRLLLLCFVEIILFQLFNSLSMVAPQIQLIWMTLHLFGHGFSFCMGQPFYFYFLHLLRHLLVKIIMHICLILMLCLYFCFIFASKPLESNEFQLNKIACSVKDQNAKECCKFLNLTKKSSQKRKINKILMFGHSF